MATVEIPDVSAEAIGLRPFSEFEAANDTWPRGDRPAAIREAAAEFRARFATPENRVQGGPHRRHRLRGLPAEVRLRRHARSAPTRTSTSSTASRWSSSRTSRGSCGRSATSRPSPRARPRRPYYAQQIERLGEFLSYKVLAKIWHEPVSALRTLGLEPEDVDFVSFDHLHVQDLRFVLGTHEPIEGEAAPREPLFPNAKLIAQRREWDTFASIHPMQWAWYVGRRHQGPAHRERGADRRRRRARQGLRARLDARPHRRQPLAVHQHERGRLGLLGERRRRRQLAPAPLEDPRRAHAPPSSSGAR